MDQSKIALAVEELSDLAICVSNDFHHLHFNYVGPEFDMLHKKVLLKYYEQAADDADEFGEWSLALGLELKSNMNEASVRIKYTSLDVARVDRDGAVNTCSELLDVLCCKYLTVFKVLEKQECPLCVGLANFIQGRLEYWAKELAYFNARRNI